MDDDARMHIILKGFIYIMNALFHVRLRGLYVLLECRTVRSYVGCTFHWDAKHFVYQSGLPNPILPTNENATCTHGPS